MSSVPIRASEFAESEYAKNQNRVIDMWISGYKDAGTIAKKLDLKRAQVVEMIDHWKEVIKSDPSFKELANQRLREMDMSFDTLIKDGHETKQALMDSEQWDKVATVIKAIADIEAKRFDAMQKTGMFEDHDMGDMLAEAERKEEAIVKLLQHVIKEFPQTRPMILNGLRRIQDPDYLQPPEVVDG